MKHLKIALALVVVGVLLLAVFAAFIWLPLGLVPIALALIAAGMLYDAPRRKTP